MDEASLQKIKKAELETIARAKGLGDNIIFHYNKPRLIQALLERNRSTVPDKSASEIPTSSARRSSRRQSIAAPPPPVEVTSTKRRRSRSKPQTGRRDGTKKRRAALDSCDVEPPEADAGDGNGAVGVEVEGAEGEGLPAQSLAVSEASRAAHDDHNDANSHVSVDEISNAAEATNVDYDATAANTDADDATVLVPYGEGSPATSKHPHPVLDEGDRSSVQDTFESELQPGDGSLPLTKLHDMLLDNEQTANMLFTLISGAAPPQSAHSSHSQGEPQLQISVLRTLKSTNISLMTLFAVTCLTPPITVEPLPDLVRTEIDQIYEWQAELFRLTNLISAQLIREHRSKRGWAKTHKREKVLEVLDRLMKGMDAARMEITRVNMERDEALIKSAELRSREEDGEGQERREGSASGDEEEDRVAVWARAVEGAEKEHVGGRVTGSLELSLDIPDSNAGTSPTRSLE